MGNILKGFLEIDGNILDKITTSQVGNDNLLVNLEIPDTSKSFVDNTQGLFKPEYPNVNQNDAYSQTITKCTDSIGKTQVQDVYSLEFVKAERDVIRNYKAVLKKRFSLRLTYLATNQFKKNELEYVEQIKSLYPDLQEYINNGSDEDKAAKEFYTKLKPEGSGIDNLKVEIEKEKQLLLKITDAGLKDRIRLFQEALIPTKGEGFLEQVTRYSNEQTAFYRFDTYYDDDTFNKLRNALKTVTFYGSEIKALNCQETGDYTNTNIEGVGNYDTKIGLRSKSNKSSKYRGLCQLPNVGSDNSIDEAVAWAKTNASVMLNSDPATPQYAIYLTIAYLGRIEEIFLSKLQNRLPVIVDADKNKTIDCIGLKNIYFSGYNKGIGYFIKAINSYLKSRKDTDYSFDSIKDAAYTAIGGSMGEDSKQEVINYIRGIKQRLT